MEVSFDIKEAVNSKGNSSAFILCLATRTKYILEKYDSGRKSGKYPPEPEFVNWRLVIPDY
jgi:arginyl-tRNA synthetase